MVYMPQEGDQVTYQLGSMKKNPDEKSKFCAVDPRSQQISMFARQQLANGCHNMPSAHE